MIRIYEDKDIEAVVSIWRTASELAHPFLTKPFLDAEAESLRTIYIKVAETWVLEIGGKVVGFIALIGNEIGGLFLDPSFHGQGFGRAMVDMAVAGKGALDVDVFEKNAIGRRFYDAYGFRRIDEYVHEASGEVTLRMAFTLKR